MKLSRILVAVLIAVASALMYRFPWFNNNLELTALDLWFQIRGPVKPPDNVILIAMDEASYDELGLAMNKAWPREVHARLLDRLATAGARKVVFDVAFLGPSGNDEADRLLSESFAKLPTAIGVDAGLAPGNETIEEVYLPYTPFRDKVEELALVALPEENEHIRRFKVKRSALTEGYRSLAEAGANLPADAPRPDLNDLVNHYGPAGTITTHSYADVLAEDFLDDSEFRDKIIYVGLILRTELGPAQKDSFQSPYTSRGRTFGVEIHAASAGNLLNETWISRYEKHNETLGIGVATFFLSLALLTTPPLIGLGVVVLGTTAWVAAAYYAFLSFILIPGASLFTIFLPLTYVLSTTVSYLTARKRQKQTEEAFSHYLSPQMAKLAARDPEALHLGGSTVEATALFTDIADFTRISESMQAVEVVEMLNAYFKEVVDVIMETNGTLIKFIGDAVFAIWGAPMPVPHHPQVATEAAIEIRKRVAEFNKNGRYPELHTRIGVHTGPMVVGNLGSEKRFDYTAIADAVNLAARLEGLNKYFGTDFLFSDAVKDSFEKDFHACSLGKVSVKGKSEVVTVFTVLPDDIPDEAELLWNQALSHFHEELWSESEAKFKTLFQDQPYFRTAAQLYLKQIPYRKMTGTDNWSGEIAFDVK